LSEQADGKPPEDPFAGEPAQEVGEPTPTGEPETDDAAADHAQAALVVPEGYLVLEGQPDGFRHTVGVVISRFNGHITSRLLQGALDALEEAGVSRDAVHVMPVPGAFELPLAAKLAAESGRYDGVVCLGAVIRGETDHYDYVCSEAARGIQDVQLQTGVPCSFGVLTVDTMEQALARTGDGKRDTGRHAVEAVLALAAVRTRLADAG
jgi:6,7-dimethyl-8-ribityllumazine synthase